MVYDADVIQELMLECMIELREPFEFFLQLSPDDWYLIFLVRTPVHLLCRHHLPDTLDVPLVRPMDFSKRRGTGSTAMVRHRPTCSLIPLKAQFFSQVATRTVFRVSSSGNTEHIAL